MAEIDIIIEQLNSDDIAERKKAIFQIGEGKIKEALPNLINVLKNDENNVVRNQAARAFGKIGTFEDVKIILETLATALKDEDIRVRANACWSLGKIKDPRSVQLLSEMVDPSQRIYSMSSETTSKQISGSAASNSLREEGMKSSDVIIAAVKALGMLKDTKGIIALEMAINDEEDGAVRCAACIALGNIKSKQATPLLLHAMEDQYWYVRRDAVKAMIKIKDAKAVAPLSKLLGDMYDEVKENAMKALIAIGKPAGEILFKEYLKDPQNKQLVTYIKKNLSKPDIKKILTTLHEKETDPNKKQIYLRYLEKLQ